MWFDLVTIYITGVSWKYIETKDVPECKSVIAHATQIHGLKPGWLGSQQS